jgi:DNA-binding CsgD family transcriptional regulator
VAETCSPGAIVVNSWLRRDCAPSSRTIRPPTVVGVGSRWGHRNSKIRPFCRRMITVLRVSRTNARRRSFQIGVTSLPRGEPGDRTAPAVLWIKDPEQTPGVPGEMLRQRFGLTPTETKTALGLAEGRMVEEIAASMQHTDATARWYVKHVLAKTGTSTRAQAASLLLRIFP